MPLKKEGLRTTESFEFTLTHADVVDLMNDTQVQLNSGNVLSTQVFDLCMQTSIGGGNEIRLRQLKPNDKLIFKFNIVTQDGTAEAVGDLDVT